MLLLAVTAVQHWVVYDNKQRSKKKRICTNDKKEVVGEQFYLLAIRVLLNVWALLPISGHPTFMYVINAIHMHLVHVLQVPYTFKDFVPHSRKLLLEMVSTWFDAH